MYQGALPLAEALRSVLLLSADVSALGACSSAILSTLFFLLFAALCYQYFKHRYTIIIPAAIAILSLALGFAVRAGIAGKNSATMPRQATQAEQEFFFIAQLLLIVVHVDLSKSMLHRAGLDSRPSRFAYATYGIVVLCFILDTVAVSKMPNPVNSHTPSRQVSLRSHSAPRQLTFSSLTPTRTYTHLHTRKNTQYTDLRISAGAIAFFWVLGHALWLPFEKALMPLLPLRDLAILIIVAWFLTVPSFCGCFSIGSAQPPPELPRIRLGLG